MADDEGGRIVGQATAQAINNLADIIQSAFPVASGVSSSAVAGGATLPANPVAFGTVTINGTNYKFPLYS